MKKTILLLMFIFVTAGLAIAQPPTETPTAPSTPVLRDDSLRMRSVDLERVKQDAGKTNADSPKVAMKSDIEKKFPEINEDFNGLQISYQEIVKAYENSTKTDYEKIETSAKALEKHAKRLNSNLFDSELKPEKDKKQKEDQTVRDLIIELDKAIVAFTRSDMFKQGADLRVVEPKVAEKAQVDLFKVIKVSEKLEKKAGKMK